MVRGVGVGRGAAHIRVDRKWREGKSEMPGLSSPSHVSFFLHSRALP